MRFVAVQQDAAARAGRQPTCDTEAVMSACSKAFEIIQVGAVKGLNNQLGLLMCLLVV